MVGVGPRGAQELGQERPRGAQSPGTVPQAKGMCGNAASGTPKYSRSEKYRKRKTTKALAGMPLLASSRQTQQLAALVAVKLMQAEMGRNTCDAVEWASRGTKLGHVRVRRSEQMAGQATGGESDKERGVDLCAPSSNVHGQRGTGVLQLGARAPDMVGVEQAGAFPEGNGRGRIGG